MSAARKLVCSTCAGSGKRSRIGPAHGPDQRSCGDCKGLGVFHILAPTGVPMTKDDAWAAMRPVQPLLDVDWSSPAALEHRKPWKPHKRDIK